MSKSGRSAGLPALAMPSSVGFDHQVGAFRRHEDRQDAVGDLARQPHAAGRDRGGVDLAAAVAVQDALQRLAEPGRVRPVIGDLVVLAPGAPAAPRAPGSAADDVDVFPRAGHRLAVGHAVPALDHLRAGGADAAEEAVARQLPAASSPSSPRRSGVRAGICMMPVPALIRVVRASTQAIGVTASRAVGLAAPDGIVAEPLGLQHQRRVDAGAHQLRVIPSRMVRASPSRRRGSRACRPAPPRPCCRDR